MSIPIYTAGYAGRELLELCQIADALDALVIDVRFSPASRLEDWRQPRMMELLNGKGQRRPRYRHLKEWGNLHYRAPELGIAIVDFEAGYQKLLGYVRQEVEARRGYPGACILLCGCLDFEGCHRSVLAECLAYCKVATGELLWDLY